MDTMDYYSGTHMVDVNMSIGNWSQIAAMAKPSIQEAEPIKFEDVVGILVPVVFSVIVVLGMAGNLLVIIIVVSNKQMRNTTNLLIINLAVADLLFIVICVPFTATGYAMTVWPFGTIFCKIYQYMINVTAYASVYTLVLMSLDRYLAVVHPVRSITIRTERNTQIVIVLSWILIMLLNIPVLMQYENFEYEFHGDKRSACISMKLIQDPEQGRIFYGCFFTFSYVIPLTLVSILYGCMLRQLLYRAVPGSNQCAQSQRNKRVSRMVVMVVLIFAICWLPIHIVLMVQYFGGKYTKSITFFSIQVASNCLAYMNSCVNPFLYAFLSETFRQEFKKLLCCGKSKQQEKYKTEYKLTDHANVDVNTQTSNPTGLRTSL